MTEQERGSRSRLYVRLAPAMFAVGLGFMLSQVFANAGPASADDPNGKVTRGPAKLDLPKFSTTTNDKGELVVTVPNV